MPNRETMSVWNTKFLIPLVIEAGIVARTYFGKTVKSFKRDDTIVTQADHEIEAFLTTKLFEHAPAVSVIGEESIETKSDEYFKKALEFESWVIDPIDGTAPFAAGLPQWGISLGYMKGGQLEHGIIFLAALGELYFTEGDSVLKLELGADPIWWSDNYKYPTEISSPQKLRVHLAQPIPKGSIIALSQQIARFGAYDLPFQIQVNGSSVFNLAKLANGNFAALITKFKIWDFAAGIPMLKRLGISASFLKSGLDMGLLMNENSIDLDGPEKWSCIDTVVFAAGTDATDLIRSKVRSLR